jgi:hypothetical protein
MVTFGSHVWNHQFQPFLSWVYAGVIQICNCSRFSEKLTALLPYVSNFTPYIVCSKPCVPGKPLMVVRLSILKFWWSFSRIEWCEVPTETTEVTTVWQTMQTIADGNPAVLHGSCVGAKDMKSPLEIVMPIHILISFSFRIFMQKPCENDAARISTCLVPTDRHHIMKMLSKGSCQGPHGEGKWTLPLWTKGRDDIHLSMKVWQVLRLPLQMDSGQTFDPLTNVVQTHAPV